MRLKKETRDQVKRLEADGWSYIKFLANGHLLLEHTSGARMKIAGSPSDWRSRKNELATARTRVRERS